MTINKLQEGTAVTLVLSGRIDTNTSPQLQAAILDAFQTGKDLTLDMEQVVYVSSAALRALLIGQKTANSKKGTMRLVKVTDMVRSILDSVGFSSILTLE